MLIGSGILHSRQVVARIHPINQNVARASGDCFVTATMLLPAHLLDTAADKALDLVAWFVFCHPTSMDGLSIND